MSGYYEATADFLKGLEDVEKLMQFSSKDEDSLLFLKLAYVLLVTKFQIFVESILQEFEFKLKKIGTSHLPVRLKINSLYLNNEKGNVFSNLKSKDFSLKTWNKITKFVNSVLWIVNDNVDDGNFLFKSKFPLGKTGKNDLINLFEQIEENPFSDFDLDKLDSVLLTRHLIVHRDRFSGTKESLEKDRCYVNKLVDYIDGYLYEKICEISARN